ncbi:MAG TPA: DnaJ domain-containing protein [Bryobacteraceae bacterium]|nr:DnaJ domain-containing protein [Bryobacteraceae bacterium]
MSAPPAGKFQDHYCILGVDPKASSETIQTAYGKLAQKYRPDNPETGDYEKFESVNLAYEVLSDANLRRSFDQLKGLDQETGVKFSGAAFFTDLSHSIDLRMAILCVLCDRRRNRPFAPSFSVRQLETMLDTNADELNFALWYLKQRGLVIMDDKSSLQITVEGLDAIEAARPDPETVLPLLKPEATAEANGQPKKSSNAAGSVRSALNNAISRR